MSTSGNMTDVAPSTCLDVVVSVEPVVTDEATESEAAIDTSQSTELAEVTSVNCLTAAE